MTLLLFVVLPTQIEATVRRTWTSSLCFVPHPVQEAFLTSSLHPPSRQNKWRAFILHLPLTRLSYDEPLMTTRSISVLSGSIRLDNDDTFLPTLHFFMGAPSQSDPARPRPGDRGSGSVNVKNRLNVARSAFWNNFL